MSNTICDKKTAASRNRRIAGNTVILFLRIFILTIVNLYAVRILLERLGAEDYGIFNAVAGVVTATFFINGALDIAIQRFYAITMGKGDTRRLKEVFSASINIIVAISIALFIVFEVTGLWFINSHMTIPADRLYAANVSFHFALLLFIMTIVQIPFSAAILTHENIKAYTMLSTLDCLLRLASAFLIGCVMADGLIFYNVALTVSVAIVLLCYIVYARSHYAECHYGHVETKGLTRRLLSFSGWTMLGPVARVGMVQGNTILLNIFFGPVANVAFAIALQINNAFGTLANCMILALRPPMIKAYAENNDKYLNSLFSASNKALFYLLLIVSVPFIMEMDAVLHLWLGKTVTPQIVFFSQLMIVFVVLMSMNSPITIIVYAVGRIKTYHLWVESVTLMCLPLTWLAFKQGLPGHYVLYVMIVIISIAHIVRIICLKHIYPSISVRQYVLSLCLPAAIISALCFAAASWIHSGMEHPLLRMLLEGACTLLVSAVLVYTVGVTRGERRLCNGLLRNVVAKRIWRH